MKMTDEVLKALGVLVDAAENDFELYRLCSLIKDLTAPPKFEQIDEKHQSFNGKIYSKDHKGYYVSTRYETVHTAIFKYFCGDIPEGYEIHHKDANKDNNDISNLQLLTKSEHTRIHMTGKSYKTRICANCGKPFKVQRKSKRKYCSLSCRIVRKSAALEKRKCVVCGKEFIAPPVYSHRKGARATCSDECLQKLTVAIWVEYNGEKMTLKDAAEKSSINYYTLKNRYHAGKRGEDLFKPLDESKSCKK